MIEFSTKSYRAKHDPTHTSGAPSIGTGIGMAIGLLCLQLLTLICAHHFYYRGTSSGVLLRGGLTTAIYRRSLRFTSRARSTLTNGKLINHISTDVSRIDYCGDVFHLALLAPIQLTVCIVILLVQLGPSALMGFGFFVLITPAQSKVIKSLFAMRKKSMAWTDKRVKLLRELLGGMKIIKFFAWEIPFLSRITELRKKEIHYIRSLLLVRAANNAVALSLPTLASVLSFVTYSLSGHTLEPAVIFTSLTLFNLLRMPLLVLRMSLSDDFTGVYGDHFHSGFFLCHR
jgi:ABC-type multidrug transport system fused ATPase/permease subunit